jgi:hypothetical protein
MVKLATPAFNGSPTDKLAAVDVYGAVDPATKNALTSQVSSFGSSLSETLGGVYNKVASIGTKLLGDKSINLDQAKDRIQRAMGGSRNDILALATSAQGAIVSELTGLDPSTNYVRKASELANSVVLITTQGKQLLNRQGYNQAGALMNFVGQLTGNPVFKALDLGAETAMLKGVLTEVSKWGIPSLVDDLIRENTARTGSSKGSYHAVSRASGTIAMTADISVIKQLIASVGVTALTAGTPNFAQLFLSRYDFKVGTTADQYPALLAELVGVMNSLKPDWFYVIRNGERIVNLAVITTASENAKTLFLSNDEYAGPSMYAPQYKPSTTLSLIKGLYPKIGIL